MTPERVRRMTRSNCPGKYCPVDNTTPFVRRLQAASGCTVLTSGKALLVCWFVGLFAGWLVVSGSVGGPSCADAVAANRRRMRRPQTNTQHPTPNTQQPTTKNAFDFA